MIDLSVIQQATQVALKHLDESFFRVRFDRLTPREKTYLRALADLGAQPQRSGEIADKLGLEVNQAAPIRNNLIKKAWFIVLYMDTAFTVPLFADFTRRTMPLS